MIILLVIVCFCKKESTFFLCGQQNSACLFNVDKVIVNIDVLIRRVMERRKERMWLLLAKADSSEGWTCVWVCPGTERAEGSVQGGVRAQVDG